MFSSTSPETPTFPHLPNPARLNRCLTSPHTSLATRVSPLHGENCWPTGPARTFCSLGFAPVYSRFAHLGPLSQVFLIPQPIKPVPFQSTDLIRVCFRYFQVPSKILANDASA